MPVNKVVGSFDEAVAGLFDGAVLLIGGFGGPGECPSYLIAAVARNGAKDLTIVGNSGGWGPDLIEALRTRMASVLRIPPDWYDPGLLVERGQVRKGILSFPAAPGHIYTPFEKAVMEGKAELELIGQGSLAERIRAAKGGIAAFYTPVGVGTLTRWVEGRSASNIPSASVYTRAISFPLKSLIETGMNGTPALSPYQCRARSASMLRLSLAKPRIRPGIGTSVKMRKSAAALPP